jgi:hypothetical protein
LNETISSAQARRLLWLAFVLILPLPFFALQIGFAPPMRMLFVASLILGVFSSAPDPTAGLYLGFFLGQGLLGSGVCYVLARVVLRWLGGPEGVRRGRFIAGLAAMAVLAMFPIYYAPYSSAQMQTNWLGLFR